MAHLQTTTQSDALDGSNGGFLNSLERLDQVVKRWTLKLPACIELCDVRTSRKGRGMIRPGDHNGLHRGVGIRGVDLVQQILAGLVAERVDLEGEV